jgi:hypothetical protein
MSQDRRAWGHSGAGVLAIEAPGPGGGGDRPPADSIRCMEFTQACGELRDTTGVAGGTNAAETRATQEGATMHTIDLDTLDHVTGGVVSARTTSNSDALTQSLSTLQSTVSTLATNNNSNQTNLLLPMAMMFAMNRRPAVVSTGGYVVA